MDEWQALTQDQRDILLSIALTQDIPKNASHGDISCLIHEHRFLNASGDGRWIWLTWDGFRIIPVEEVERAKVK